MGKSTKFYKSKNGSYKNKDYFRYTWIVPKKILEKYDWDENSNLEIVEEVDGIKIRTKGKK